MPKLQIVYDEADLEVSHLVLIDTSVICDTCGRPQPRPIERAGILHVRPCYHCINENAQTIPEDSDEIDTMIQDAEDYARDQARDDAENDFNKRCEMHSAIDDLYFPKHIRDTVHRELDLEVYPSEAEARLDWPEDQKCTA